MQRVLVNCKTASDRSWCASVAFGFGLEAGLSRIAARELSIAVSELASNMCRHADGGQLLLSVISEPRQAVEVIAHDDGPGIADVDRALTDGWSCGRRIEPGERHASLGAGLGAVKRLMSELQVASAPACGTTVIARKWIAGARP